MSSYEIKDVDINQLKLDPTNCRFLYRSKLEQKESISDDDIIKYLSDYENLTALVERIKSEGWLTPNEPFVIAFTDTEEYIVKEGNRRIAALKTLIKQQHNIEGVVDNKISVKIYSDLKLLQKSITKIHTEGNEQWDPWAKAMHEQAEGIKTIGAHVIGFILRKEIKDILDKPKCYTILIDSLTSKEARERLRITLTEDKFEFPSITEDDMVLFIKEIVKAYGRTTGDENTINTRTRKNIPTIIENIKIKIESKKTQEKKDNSPLFPSVSTSISTPDNSTPPESSTEETSNPTVPLSSVDSPNDKKPRRKYPDSIKTSADCKEWIEELCKKYTSRTSSYNSYLSLRDMQNLTNNYNIKMILCRVIWDSLLVEYFGKYPKDLPEMPAKDKSEEKRELEYKSESICQSYTAKLKNEFPDIADIKDIIKHAQRNIGHLNDVVHGYRYYNSEERLFAILTDIYPLLLFLVNLVNEHILPSEKDPKKTGQS